VQTVRKVETALIVDDNDAFRTTLQGSLRRRGVRASTAATAVEGLAALEDQVVDLVVLDYQMPRTDGLAALPRFRHAAPEAAIVLLTGFGDIPLAVAAVKEGADTVLTKPIDADRLLREGAAILESNRPAARATAPQGILNLDELEREAIRAALRQSGGVVVRAAELLGIDRRTLQRKLRRLE
jgi:two-component system response regulator RegA